MVETTNLQNTLLSRTASREPSSMPPAGTDSEDQAGYRARLTPFERAVENMAARAGVSLDEIRAAPAPPPGYINLGPPQPIDPDRAPTILDPRLYDCSLCCNRGYRVWRDSTGGLHSETCRCMPIRASLMRLRRSGLSRAIDRYSLDRYQTLGDQTRQAILDGARDYVADPCGWFFIGGGTGTGKTHICAGICRELIASGMETRYIMWRDEAPRAKSRVNTPEYADIVEPWKTCQLLYIDDLFKTGRADGKPMRPTSADVSLAYEILNYRYMDPDKLTIISTELPLRLIIELDGAVGGRIAEMASSHVFHTGNLPNWRVK